MRLATHVSVIGLCAVLMNACNESAPADAEMSVVPAGITPPATVPFVPVVDTMHGVPVVDPLRWMEDTTNADVRAWLTAQKHYTDSVMARLVGRDSLEARVKQGMSDLPTLGDVHETPSRLIVERWFGENPSLFALDNGTTTERPLLTDSALASARNGASLRASTPSWDGRFVVLGTTERGDANAALSVVDAASGALMADNIPDLLTTTSGTRYEVTWLPDNSGFIYPRQWPGSANGPPAERLARGRQFLHRIGTPQSADVPIFGYGVSSSVAFDPIDLPTRVLTGSNTEWMVGSIFRSRENGTEYYATRNTAPNGLTWTRIASFDDLIRVPQLVGDTVYAISRRNADRGSIVRRVLRDAGADTTVWETVIAERRGVITGFSVQSDGLYFMERDAGAIALLHVATNVGAAVSPGALAEKTSPRVVPLPESGTVTLLRRNATMAGAVLNVQSWATTPRWLRVSNGEVNALGIDDGYSATSSAQVVSSQLEAPSRDGELVPVSIVYDSSTATLDGSAPLLIEAYGGFGTITDPRFDPKVTAWLSQGGVYAYAHVRGGGERGDAWHKAATRENKQRTIDDMIGAIEALIAKRYTSAKRVVITGTSFGANIPGLVIAQRPELLGAVLYEVGQPDEIRGSMIDPTAARNIAEIGDLETEAGIRSLLKSSPYYQIPERITLPAVLLHSASDDYNFGNEMLVGKFVARLQAANTGDCPIVWARTPGGHAELFYLSPEWAAKTMSFLLWQTGQARFQPVAR